MSMPESGWFTKAVAITHTHPHIHTQNPSARTLAYNASSWMDAILVINPRGQGPLLQNNLYCILYSTLQKLPFASRQLNTHVIYLDRCLGNCKVIPKEIHYL